MCHKRKNLPSLCIALSTNMLILLNLLHWIHSVNLVKFHFKQIWSNSYAVELFFKANLFVGFSLFFYCFLSNILFCYKFPDYEMDFSKFLQCDAGWERISKRKLQQHSFIASPFVTWHGPFFKVEIFTISMADPLICSDPRWMIQRSIQFDELDFLSSLN